MDSVLKSYTAYMVKLFYSHFGRKRYFTISRRYILQQRMINLVFKRRTKCYNSKTYRYCNTVFSTMESTCWQGRGPMSIGDPLTVTRGGGMGFIKNWLCDILQIAEKANAS